MISKRNLTPLWALLLPLALTAGCGPKSQSSSPAASGAPTAAGPQSEREAEPGPGTSQATSETPVKNAVEQLLTEQDTSDHPFIPKGTKLISADFKDGVATLDFTREFNALADRGDSVESEAQKALRHALAGIPGVDKMRVTVEGKPFESQATDWNTPFPVRDTVSEGEEHEADAADQGGDKH